MENEMTLTGMERHLDSMEILDVNLCADCLHTTLLVKAWHDEPAGDDLVNT